MVRGPDIMAEIRFYTTKEGAENPPHPPRIFKFPLDYEGEKFDCGLHLDTSGPVALGETVKVPITLLCPELIKPRLKAGSRFTLWDGRTIAEGEVINVLHGSEGQDRDYPVLVTVTMNLRLSFAHKDAEKMKLLQPIKLRD